MAEITEARILNDLFADRKKGRDIWKIDAPSRRITEAKTTYWIYNTSPRKHAVSALPGMPRTLVACPEGAKYGVPIEIKEVTLDYSSIGDYKLKAVEVDDSDLVQAIVHPNSPVSGTAPGDGTDLRIWGVFYSKNNPPTEAELSLARARLVETYSLLVRQADTIWENPSRRWQITGINGEVNRMAAKELKLQRPWCSILVEKETCPVCKKGIEKGSARCEFCTAILDWDLCLKYRIVSKDQYAEAVADGLVPQKKAAKTLEEKQAEMKARQ